MSRIITPELISGCGDINTEAKGAEPALAEVEADVARACKRTGVSKSMWPRGYSPGCVGRVSVINQQAAQGIGIRARA